MVPLNPDVAAIIILNFILHTVLYKFIAFSAFPACCLTGKKDLWSYLSQTSGIWKGNSMQSACSREILCFPSVWSRSVLGWETLPISYVSEMQFSSLILQYILEHKFKSVSQGPEQLDPKLDLFCILHDLQTSFPIHILWFCSVPPWQYMWNVCDVFWIFLFFLRIDVHIYTYLQIHSLIPWLWLITLHWWNKTTYASNDIIRKFWSVSKCCFLKSEQR